MTMMDERLAQRRRGVSEDRARRRLRWVIAAIITVLVVAGGAWLIRSPILSVRAIDITGAERSNPQSVIDELGVAVGTPTIDVDGAEIERGIEADPWVSDAVVAVSWPGSVTVTVTEHVPMAVAEWSAGSVLVAIDGSTIVPPDEASELPTIEVGERSLTMGATSDDPLVLGALTFIAALSEERRAATTVTISGDTLAATVDGHAIRLGRPIDMALKAAVVESLIDNGVAAGATIDVIAPTRPAVGNPQPLLEAEE